MIQHMLLFRRQMHVLEDGSGRRDGVRLLFHPLVGASNAPATIHFLLSKCAKNGQSSLLVYWCIGVLVACTNLIIMRSREHFFAIAMQQNGMFKLGSKAALDIAKRRIRLHDATLTELPQR